jgi:hypothetical protein
MRLRSTSRCTSHLSFKDAHGPCTLWAVRVPRDSASQSCVNFGYPATPIRKSHPPVYPLAIASPETPIAASRPPSTPEWKDFSFLWVLWALKHSFLVVELSPFCGSCASPRVEFATSPPALHIPLALALICLSRRTLGLEVFPYILNNCSSP